MTRARLFFIILGAFCAPFFAYADAITLDTGASGAYLNFGAVNGAMAEDACVAFTVPQQLYSSTYTVNMRSNYNLVASATYYLSNVSCGNANLGIAGTSYDRNSDGPITATIGTTLYPGTTYYFSVMVTGINNGAVTNVGAKTSTNLGPFPTFQTYTRRYNSAWTSIGGTPTQQMNLTINGLTALPVDHTLQILSPANLTQIAGLNTNVNFQWNTSTSSTYSGNIYVCVFTPLANNSYTQGPCDGGGTTLVPTGGNGSSYYNISVATASQKVIHIYRGPISFDALPGTSKGVDYDEISLGFNMPAATNTDPSAPSLYPNSTVTDACNGLVMDIMHPYNYLLCAGLTLFTPSQTYVDAVKATKLASTSPACYVFIPGNILTSLSVSATSSDFTVPINLNGATTSIISSANVRAGPFSGVITYVRTGIGFLLWLMLFVFCVSVGRRVFSHI